MTIREFIKSTGITMSSERVDANPNMDGSHNMDHWRCVMRAGHSRMTTYFSMGFGHRGAEPKLAEVLGCLVSDAGALDQSFEDWCDDLGLDADSRKAERTFKTCVRQATKLKTFLGASGFDNLLQAEQDA